jgi:hypothetical protein
MTGKSHLNAEAAAELVNLVANQVVSRILNETRAAGGSHSDLLVICESVLVGVVVECFSLGAEDAAKTHPTIPISGAALKADR